MDIYVAKLSKMMILTVNFFHKFSGVPIQNRRSHMNLEMGSARLVGSRVANRTMVLCCSTRKHFSKVRLDNIGSESSLAK